MGERGPGKGKNGNELPKGRSSEKARPVSLPLSTRHGERKGRSTADPCNAQRGC